MIEHQPNRKRFVASSQGQESVLEYRQTDDHINFTRTYVPDALRGQGIAKQLVEAGLYWAKEQGYTIEADCWYVAKFLDN